MKVISFDSQICHNLEQSLKKEWIETNQFGGYASSTIISANTRRHHGLFVPELKSPLGRHVLLSNVEEILYVDDIAYPLSTQIFPGTIYPEGYKNINEFTLLPFPTWTYYIEDLVLMKSIIFMYSEQTVIIRYQLLEGEPDFVRLEIKPLTPFRKVDSLTRMNNRFNTKIEVASERIRFAGLFFHHNAAILDQSGGWYKNIYYSQEKERGLDFEEDLFHPFRLVYTFLNQKDVFLSISLHERERVNSEALISEEANRRSQILKDISITDSRFQLLAYSGHKFFVKSKNNSTKTAIAASPWFEISARAALIAFHGLTLSTAQYQIARDVLSFYAAQIKDGLLPNSHLVNEDSDLISHKNELRNVAEIDTPLWLVHAVFEYAKRSDDGETMNQLFPILKSIVDSFVKGTHFNIHMTEDGLIEGALKGKPLTWMNAMTETNIPITPREGKAVEVQALWYNALCILIYFSERLGKSSLQKSYQELASLARRSFNSIFWNSSSGYLFDVVNGKINDSSLRPNQLMALSLPFSILEDDSSKFRSILEAIKQNLLTPYGLRSLCPTDPNYQPTSKGDRLKRSRAYHQGSVWPWLLVPYFNACLKISADPIKEKTEFLKFLEPLIAHTEERGLGFVSEIFDGETPHEAREATAYTMNLAACLELYEILIGDQKNSAKRNLPSLILKNIA